MSESTEQNTTETPETEAKPKAKKGGSKDRIAVLGRFFLAIIMVLVFELIQLAVHLIVPIQFIIVLITGSHNESLRRFMNRMSEYAYDVMRYMTLNSNKKPFPFGSYPAQDTCEKPVDEVEYNRF
ncbi:MAG: DUF4389 domain-containing protein [Desulfovibrio sp.]